MAGRMSFTRDETEQLRSLLRELRRADRDRQKTIRARMRRMGFYITDLDELISRGTIKVEA
jgi:hypothetical protein